MLLRPRGCPLKCEPFWNIAFQIRFKRATGCAAMRKVLLIFLETQWVRKWCAAALLATAATSRAGVALDGSLGSAAKSLPGPNYMIPADAGAKVGSNLFHSFSQFSLT